MTETFECPNCGAPLQFDNLRGETVIACSYCQSAVIVPEALRVNPPVSQETDTVSPPEFANLFGFEDLEHLQQIIALTRQGQKIQAIKLYREYYDADLAQAKEAVDNLERGQPIAVTKVQMTSRPFNQILDEPNAQITGEISELLSKGQKIQAIKRFRETFDVGLKDAKDAVEEFERTGMMRVIRSNPPAPVFSRPKAAATVSSGGCYGYGLAIFILLVTLIPVTLTMMSSGGPLEEIGWRINPFSIARLTNAFGSRGIGSGQFTDPRGIAIDPNGNLFVSEYSDGRLSQFTPNGELLNLWNIGQDWYIDGLVLDNDGRVYLLQRGDLMRFDPHSGSMGTVSYSSSQDLRFDHLTVSPDGALAVLVNTKRYAIYEQNGNIRFDNTGNENPAESESVEDAAIDALGNLYVLGWPSDTISKYAPDGELVLRFGGDGEGDGLFTFPRAIAIDGQGRIYVSDMFGIQVFHPDGRYIDRFDIPGFVFDMQFADDGTLWAVSNTPKVYQYTITR